MSSRKQDIEFLRTYLRQRRRWYEESDDLVWADLDEPPARYGKEYRASKKRAEHIREAYEAEEKRVAGLAEANGLDPGPFLDYLLETPGKNPLRPKAIERLGRKIQTCTRLIAKLEGSEEDATAETHAIAPLSPNELKLLHDMADYKGACRVRATIAASTEISESTLKTLLPALEKEGLIERPRGPRSGYAITVKGIERTKALRREKPRPTD